MKKTMDDDDENVWEERLEHLLRHVQNFKTVVLHCTEPTVKTQLLYFLTKGALDKGNMVDYLDLDLQFSSLMRTATKYPLANAVHLWVSQPSEDSLEECILNILCRPLTAPWGGLTIVDSVNTLQQLLQKNYNDTDSINANHRTAVYVTLLSRQAQESLRTLLVSNMPRARPGSLNEHGAWNKEPVGGRMLRLKAQAIMEVSRAGARSNAQYSTAVERRLLVKITPAAQGEVNMAEHRMYEFTLPSPI